MYNLMKKIAVKVLIYAETKLSQKEGREMMNSSAIYEIAKERVQLKRRYEIATKNNKKKFENNLKKLNADEKALTKKHSNNEVKLEIFPNK